MQSTSIHSQKIEVTIQKIVPMIPPINRKPSSGCTKSCMSMAVRCN